MLGLNYGSSDEEELAPPKNQTRTIHEEPAPQPIQPALKTPSPVVELTQPSNNAAAQDVQGPAMGPSIGSATGYPLAGTPAAQDASAPQSPYSMGRTMRQNLTMPTIPNFDVPPSPPGSPPPGPTKRFEEFLKLKKKGKHFNERLEKSSALRNPSHLQKMMDFAGIGELDQYASTLPDDLAVPSKFPDWAYADRLNTTQKEITKQREEAQTRVQREVIDFVPASASGTSSKAATPSKKVSRFDLPPKDADRGLSGNSTLQDRSKRRDYERRGGRDDDYSRSRHRSRSRSPRRRR